MAMYQLPVVPFAPKYFSHAQFEADSFGRLAHADSGSLKPDPIGDAVTSCHVQNLERTLACRLEDRGIALVSQRHFAGTFDASPTRTKERCGIDAGNHEAQRSWFTADIGSRGARAAFHELIEV